MTKYFNMLSSLKYLGFIMEIISYKCLSKWLYYQNENVTFFQFFEWSTRSTIQEIKRYIYIKQPLWNKTNEHTNSSPTHPILQSAFTKLKSRSLFFLFIPFLISSFSEFQSHRRFLFHFTDCPLIRIRSLPKGHLTPFPPPIHIKWLQQIFQIQVIEHVRIVALVDFIRLGIYIFGVVELWVIGGRGFESPSLFVIAFSEFEVFESGSTTEF